ncbi:hypothetical protein C9374_008154 [Naegleria lovaniensis]|uniref:PQ-loop-domain-containing protein n=1 Tax=Naegleria lovaniensis TaxID=51637 RepID=A0AA88GKP9_NAELO|nr:uncharacterized protein C9374_008154 [Naegleria lovaniensis]KAG2378515.1 hypothetical protein C9374_008154 [Naegleria lovaniensis]
MNINFHPIPIVPTMFSIIMDSNNASNTTNDTANCIPLVLDGYHYIPWMYSVLGACIRTPLEQASFWIGLSSIGFWLFANLPQIIENYRKSNAESLAPAFLLQWILGDSLNLIGSILADQLATQIATAVYYVLMDFILIGQYIYYKLKDRIKQKRAQNNININGFEDGENNVNQVAVTYLGTDETQSLISHNGDGNNNVQNYSKILGVSALFFTACLFWMQQFGFSTSSSNFGEHRGVGRKLLSVPEDFIDYNDQYWPIYGKDIAGYVIGSLSTCLYLGSRIPQIIKNFRRMSTDGLSPILFICAFMGNTTYAASLFLYNTSWQFIVSRLPWILGSAGVLVMDFTILLQFLFFNVVLKKKKELNEVKFEKLEEESDVVDENK